MPYESLIIRRHDDGISPTSSPCLLLHSFVKVFVIVTSGKMRKTCKLSDNYNEIQSDCVKRKRHDIRFYFAWQTLKGRERSTFFCLHWNPFSSSVNETDADMCSSVKWGRWWENETFEMLKSLAALSTSSSLLHTADTLSVELFCSFRSATPRERECKTIYKWSRAGE